MAATRPARRVLEGRYIRVEPLQRGQLPELFHAIGHPAVFTGGFGGGPGGYRDTEAAFVVWADGYFSWDTGNVCGIRLLGGPHNGALVGTSTLGDFDEKNEHAHIGWTAFAPAAWGTAVNPEEKLLMLGEAFAHGFGRVKLQADAINDRSRAAIAKLGAKFEGVIRRDRQRADGSWRDTAVFSVLAAEWPAVRAELDARLATHDGRPLLYRSTLFTPPLFTPTDAAGSE